MPDKEPIELYSLLRNDRFYDLSEPKPHEKVPRTKYRFLEHNGGVCYVTDHSRTRFLMPGNRIVERA